VSPPKINLKEEYTLQVKALSELAVSELWKEIKVTEEEIWGDLKTIKPRLPLVKFRHGDEKSPH